MILIKEIRDMQQYVHRLKKQSVGFVPTMGDLHEGHLELVKRSKNENDVTVVSIFVNPAQFDNKEDLQKYYRNTEKDLEQLEALNVDVVFTPNAEEMYPKDFQTWVEVEKLSKPLCGAFRPGHFRGVATVVLKLFNLVQPTNAYFGLKDYQQYKVIEQMVKDLSVPVKLVPCSTVREASGLALSSRNRRLSAKEKERAQKISETLHTLKDTIRAKHGIPASVLAKQFKKQVELSEEDRLEYLEFVNPETLQALEKATPPILIATAIRIGTTRLIDNVLILK